LKSSTLDALLAARAGFGKSTIFHTWVVLTTKFIIQLVLLSKLGGKQAELRRDKQTPVSQTKTKDAIVISPEEVVMHWLLELVHNVYLLSRSHRTCCH
jgi:hypothetical protein